MSYVQDSISLDLAYLTREVPAIIDTLAQDALQEVEDAASNQTTTGSDTRKDHEAVVSGQTG